MHTQIHVEVTDFWSVLEAVAAARHSELLSVLNKHLGSLSSKVLCVCRPFGKAKVARLTHLHAPL
jgi:hypothetical protein